MTVRGEVGWGALAAAIIGWDLWAIRTGHETLSAAYGRALTGRARPAVLALTFYLVGHLCGSLLPPWCGRLDLLSALARALTPKETLP